MAVLDDILTAAKNIVTAINGLGITYNKIEGNETSAEVSTAKQLFTGQGRLVRVSVTTAGSSDAAIYDTAIVSSITGKSVGYVHKDANVVEFGVPIRNGLVVVPGNSQKLVVVYSKG